MIDRHTSLNENKQAAEVLNDEFPGLAATVIDHRDCKHGPDHACTPIPTHVDYCDDYGDGIKIAVDFGNASEISEIMNDTPNRVALPGSEKFMGWVEPINEECLRFLISDESQDTVTRQEGWK